MPLTITIPGRELWDEKNQKFIEFSSKTLTLEHSLISVSKWEAKWKKPYLTNKRKTREEVIDYVRCMTISGNVDHDVYYGLTRKNLKDIEHYINDSMTATTFTNKPRRSPSEYMTNETIYYYMTALNIPFSCEKWHLNHLLTLIEVANRKQEKPKKMRPSAVASQYASLNAARRAKHRSRG